MSISKENIPSVGDTVEKTILSKCKGFIQITFSSGKKCVIQLDGKITEPSVKKEGLIISPKKAEPINPSLKNTPQDPDYKIKAQIALAKLSGVPLEEIAQQFSQPPMETLSSNSAPDGDFRDQAQKALERAQEQSTRLAEQISSKNGGKMESSFGGKSTITLG